MIDLSKNTNCFYPNKRIYETLKNGVDNIKSYANDYVKIENTKFLKKYNISSNNTVVTNGTMEAMDLVLRSLELNILGIFNPTFWGIKEAAEKNCYSLVEKKIDISTCYNEVEINELASNSDIVYLCNDNNPTLNYIDSNKLLAIIKENTNCFFVIDETVLTFNIDFDNKTLIKNVNEFDNLIVLLSLSKIFGICGLRCGLIFANEKLTDKFRNKQMPYSTNIISCSFIKNNIDEFMKLKKCRIKIRENFRYFIENVDKDILKKIIYNDSSFILAELNYNIDYDDFVSFVEKNGVIISPVNKYYSCLPLNYIRISSGKKKDFTKLISIIRKYKEEKHEKSLY